MDFFINLLTLTACFATMLYCYVLAKRIQTFRNMKDGVGALIEEMIRTTTDLQTAFNATQKNIDNQYYKLQDKIDEGVALSEYLSTLIDNIENNIYTFENVKQSINSNNLSDVVNHSQKISTLPDTLKLPINLKNLTINPTSNNSDDPLSDVMPADFNRYKNKKRPKIIIPGEEYL